MAHRIQAIIANKEAIERFTSRWPGAGPVYLPQEFALCRLGATLRRTIEAEADAADVEAGFTRLTGPVRAAIGALSFEYPIAYVETDYTDGIGTQAAAVFHQGELRFGPKATRDVEPYVEGDVFASADRAVNGALAYLGVWTKGSRDEWDMLKLYNFREL